MAEKGNMSPRDHPVSSSSSDQRRRSFSSMNNSGLVTSVVDLDYQLFSSRTKNNDWFSNMGSQNLVSVLNDPTTIRSQTDCVLTKDWGSSFVETEVYVEPVSVTRRQLEFMGSFLKAVRKRAKAVLKFSLLIQSTAVTRRTTLPNQNLNRIPELFLHKNFDLQDVKTFESVLEFSSLYKKDGTDDCKLTGESVRESQGHLSDVLDLVEDNLSSQISARFRDFFHIMNAMDILMDQVTRTIKEVTAVRSRCEQLKNCLVKPSLLNILLTRVRNNARLYLSKLLLMDEMYQSNSRINSLLSQRDYIAALQLISSSWQVMNHQLLGVNCFKHLASELSEREKLIEKFLDEDLNKLLTTEWLQPFDSQSSRSTPILIEDEALCNIVGGMVRVRKFNFVDEFREEACAAVITVIKQTLIQAMASEDFDVNNRLENHLYNQMKVIHLKKWLSIVDDTFSNLKILLRRISAVNQVILKTLHAAAGKDWTAADSDTFCHFLPSHEVSLTDEECVKWCSATTQSLVSLCDFAQSRCSNLIERRLSETADRLSFHDFSSFVKSIQSFCATAEFLSGHPCPNLKAVLQTQADRFTSRFHEEKKKKLNSLLDIEQWKTMDSVSRDFQSAIHQIIEGRVNGTGRTNFVTANNSHKESSHVVIREEKFLVVNSVVTLVMAMFEYWTTSADMPVICTDLLVKLVDLLKHFNARTRDLVLEGNAKQVAGLKSITSRTLINSCRALQLVLQLLPSIKFHFKNMLPEEQKKLITNFSEVFEAFEEHVNKINERVVYLSSEFISTKLLKWEAKPPVPSPQFVAVTQHLSVLDANLEDSMPPDQMSLIFGKIDSAFKISLREQLQRLGITNDGGPQHGLVTQEMIFYTQSMNKKSVGKCMKFTGDDLWPRIPSTT